MSGFRECALRVLFCWLSLGALTHALAEDPERAGSFEVRVEGTRETVTAVRSGKILLLKAKPLAIVLGQEAKVVSEGKLLTFCQTGDEEFCVPVSLRNVVTVGKGDDLFVEAAVVARALRLEIEDRKGVVTIRRSTAKRSDEDDIPAFNAAWAEGRGFRAGQTLPDIPLMDMDGQEVRFSQFLGKRYIIYCWASW
jgi:hypothetical protein